MQVAVDSEANKTKREEEVNKRDNALLLGSSKLDIGHGLGVGIREVFAGSNVQRRNPNLGLHRALTVLAVPLFDSFLHGKQQLVLLCVGQIGHEPERTESTDGRRAREREEKRKQKFESKDENQ